MAKRCLLICSALVVLTLVIAILAYPHLPERIPTRWNIWGEVSATHPKAFVFLLGPGLICLNLLLFSALPWFSPERFRIEPFLSTYQQLVMIVMGLITYLFCAIVLGSIVEDVAVDRWVFSGVALLFVLGGNLLGKVRQNFFIGIRTPWTLADERVWHATHRVAARFAVLGGLAGLLAAWTAPLWSVIAILISTLLLSVVYSAWYYKKLRRADPP